MEFFWSTYIDILKIILSWPPIALVMLIIIIFLFKDQISSLLGRVTGGKILGNEFVVAPSSQIDTSTRIEKDTLSANAQRNESDTANTKSEHTNAQSTQASSDNPAINYILSHPHETLIEYQRVLRHLNFEILFNRIFGTQISLLDFLSTNPTKTYSAPQLYHFYQNHQRLAASHDYQIRDYFNFLVTFQVIKVDVTENEHYFSITDFGLEFLSYIKANYKGSWNLRSL